MKKSIIFVTLIAALAMTGCKNNSVPAAKVETTTIEAATVTEAETTKADTAEAEVISERVRKNKETADWAKKMDTEIRNILSY